jgi:Fur family transcriptional regulator, ferric uptake regulator
MTEVIDTFTQTLKRSGYSNTAARRMVFEVMQGHEPMTMREIVQACANKVDRASIYRSMLLFEKLGIVQRLQIGWKYKLELSDVFSNHHHHCSCIKCGRVIPLAEDQTLETQLLALARAAHFTPQDHQLEIRGLCADCQAL